MTLDVTIGRAKLELNKDIEDGHFWATVVACPPATENICKPEYTRSPKESDRSGSTDFWDFWRKKNPKLNAIYERMRDHPSSNDMDVCQLKPYASEIAELNENDFDAPIDRDRLRWLKYWTSKALELYGDEAAIQFS